jgi:hypothetical protein
MILSYKLKCCPCVVIRRYPLYILVKESLQKQQYFYHFGLFLTLNRCATKLVLKISVPQAQKG